MSIIQTMRNVIIKVTGARGPSFADVARRVGNIAGIPVPSDATDLQVMSLLSEGLNAVVAAAGYTVIAPVVAATTANITLSGAQTIDGVAVTAGQRVLVKNQSSGAANGIYVAAAGSWSRATDFDIGSEVIEGSYVVVQGGETQRGSWVLVTADPITVGTTALTFYPWLIKDLTRADLQTDEGAGIVNFSWASTYLAGSVGEKLQRGPLFLTDSNFGVHPNNSPAANDEAIGRAMDKMASWEGGDVVLPTGRGDVFRTSATIVVPGSTTIDGQGYGIGGPSGVDRAATSIRYEGDGWAVHCPRVGGDHQTLRGIAFYGTEDAVGGLDTGSGDGMEEFTSSLRTDRLLFTGFTGEGAIAFNARGVQRGFHTDLRFISNWTHIRTGPSSGNDFLRGNLSSNDYRGKAVDGTGGGAGGVNLSMREIYYESCPGEKPIDCSNAGQYWFEGGGGESLCYKQGVVIEDPTMFFFGPNASARVYLRSLGWGYWGGIVGGVDTGEDVTGIISFVRRSAGTTIIEAGVLVANMDYTGGGRSGHEYRFWDGGDYGAGIIPLPGRYTGAGFATIAQARAAYALGNNITYPSKSGLISLGSRIAAADGTVYTPMHLPYRKMAPLLADGNVTIPTYTGEVTGAGTFEVWSETYQVNEFQAPQTIILHIQGKRSGTAGGKKLRLKVAQGVSTPRYIDITPDTTAAQPFSAEVRIRAMGRLHQLVTVKYQDGSSSDVVHTELLVSPAAIDLIAGFTLSLECVIASAGDKMTILDVAEDPR